MDSPPRIWVLTDARPGNRTQSLGVAAHLPWPVEEKRLAFNPLVKLPNRLLGATFATLDFGRSAELTAPWPDIVIAAGRHLVPAMRAIKRRNPRCLLVYLMDPQAGYGEFDLLAIPAHDQPTPRPNLFVTQGAVHGLTPETLAAAATEWTPWLAHLPAPRIALLAGGDSRSARFTLEDFHDLGQMASHIAERSGGSLMVTTSPRTSPEQTNFLRLSLSAHHEFHQWTREGENPYHGYLASADAVIITADSMSMAAEACGTGKPVAVFVPRQGMIAPKLQRFHDTLFASGQTRPLTANMRLDWEVPAPLNEAARVADEIVKIFEDRHPVA